MNHDLIEILAKIKQMNEKNEIEEDDLETPAYGENKVDMNNINVMSSCHLLRLGSPEFGLSSKRLLRA